MLQNNIIIHRDNGVIKDLSLEASDYLAGSSLFPFVAAEDELYIGSDLPFNHRWFEMAVPNDAASAVSIEIYDGGGTWIPAINLYDETSVGGKSLARSGNITFQPNPLESSWIWQNTDQIVELASLKIFYLYWVRLKFSANLNALTAIKYIGHKFCSEAQLFIEYPELNSSTKKNAHTTSKTSWDDQIFTASEYCIQDLKANNVVYSPNQILDWRLFKNACVHKTAEIIYQAFGEDYVDKMNSAGKKYTKNIQIKSYAVDTNRNATLDEKEKTLTTDFLSR